jgi:hypothetical protein
MLNIQLRTKNALSFLAGIAEKFTFQNKAVAGSAWLNITGCRSLIF